MLGRLGSKSLDESGAQLPRLGRELAGAAKLAGVKGIFHADELPAYGITQHEVDEVRTALTLASDDAFVLCCALPGKPRWLWNRLLTVLVWRGIAFPKKFAMW